MISHPKNKFYTEFALFFALTMLVIISCKETTPYVITPNKVEITSAELVPASIDIGKGKEVIWTNNDTVQHLIKSGSIEEPDNYFEIGPISPGESISMKFDSLGSFTYYCPKNPHLLFGIINVQKDTLENEPFLPDEVK